MTAGPVNSEHLYGAHTNLLEQHVAEQVSRSLHQPVLEVQGFVSRAMRDAYASGLRDGFAQGVAAGHNEKEVAE